MLAICVFLPVKSPIGKHSYSSSFEPQSTEFELQIIWQCKRILRFCHDRSFQRHRFARGAVPRPTKFHVSWSLRRFWIFVKIAYILRTPSVSSGHRIPRAPGGVPRTPNPTGNGDMTRIRNFFAALSRRFRGFRGFCGGFAAVSRGFAYYPVVPTQGFEAVSQGFAVAYPCP